MSTHFHSRLLPLCCCLLLLSHTGCPPDEPDVPDDPEIIDCNTLRYLGHDYPDLCLEFFPGADCFRQYRITAVDNGIVIFTADLVCDDTEIFNVCCIESVTIVDEAVRRDEEVMKEYNFVTATEVQREDGSVITMEYYAGPEAALE